MKYKKKVFFDVIKVYNYQKNISEKVIRKFYVEKW